MLNFLNVENAEEFFGFGIISITNERCLFFLNDGYESANSKFRPSLRSGLNFGISGENLRFKESVMRI